jgi:predicted membrane protein DUF2142
VRPRLLLLLVGILLAQAAWLLSVPAFRGLDEFDHVYRAASVARGQWLPSGDRAAHGRGELVTVPRDLVDAAGPECRALPYTGHDNCAPVVGVGHGEVRVASAAAGYQPVYYWLVGTAGRGLHGTAAVDAMRAVSALLCALFVLLAGWTLSRWARTVWPSVALVGCLTPVLVYSSVVVAPNALEIVAAVSVWVALGGLCARGVTPRAERALLWSAVPGAVVLANVRSLGIPFLGVIVLTVLLVLGRSRIMGLLHRHARTAAACGAVVGAAVAAGAWWVLTAAPKGPEQHLGNHGAVAGSLVQVPVWVLQTVGAAPGRRDPAPGLTYLLCGGLLAWLAVLGLRRSETRLRLAVEAIAVLSVAAPLVVTLATYRDVGVIWQGRYGMPVSLGVLLLAGLALDRAGTLRHPGRRVLVAAGALFAAGQAVAVVHVLRMEAATSPSVAAGLWHPPSEVLVGALTVLGWLLVAASLPGPEPLGRAAPLVTIRSSRPRVEMRIVTREA